MSRSRPLVEIPETLLHGTMSRSLRSIARIGLAPGQDKSAHATKTKNATFFTDSMEAAMAYSDAADRADRTDDKHHIAVIVVDASRLPIEPDFDDCDFTDGLDSLSKDVGVRLSIGGEIDEAIVPRIERELESWDYMGGIVPFSVAWRGERAYLMAEPYVEAPCGEPKFDEDEDVDVPDGVRQRDDGAWVHSAKQYLCRCSVLPRLVKGVFVSKAVAAEHGLYWPERRSSGRRLFSNKVDTTKATLVHVDNYPQITLGYYPLSAFQAR